MIYFISDLHLSSSTPGIARIFTNFLCQLKPAEDCLYILGDFFETWPGDDCIDDASNPFNLKIVKMLRNLSDSGVAVSIMHGNRDFLLNEEFAKRSGIELIADPFVLDLPVGRFVLSHGDELCTADKEYQNFRALVRQPSWQAAFLKKPLEERQVIAAALRQQSENARPQKPEDAESFAKYPDEAAIISLIRNFASSVLIHGHIHYPGVYKHTVDEGHVERWVLPDWREDCGECLVFDGQTLCRRTLS